MSDGSTGAVGPVSVRYAAQIRDLLYAKAVQRMVADEQAARAQSEAERAARVEPVEKPTEPLDVKVDKSEPVAYVAAKPAPADKPAVTTGQLVDIQA